MEVASFNHPSYHVIMPHLMHHHKLYWWNNTAHLRKVSSHDTNSSGRSWNSTYFKSEKCFWKWLDGKFKCFLTLCPTKDFEEKSFTDSLFLCFNFDNCKNFWQNNFSSQFLTVLFLVSDWILQCNIPMLGNRESCGNDGRLF